MHLIDTERVFAYRALAAARGDETPVYRFTAFTLCSPDNVCSRANCWKIEKKPG